MDPEATVSKILALVKELRQRGLPSNAEILEELAENVNNLKEWTLKGGYTPANWAELLEANAEIKILLKGSSILC